MHELTLSIALLVSLSACGGATEQSPPASAPVRTSAPVIASAPPTTAPADPDPPASDLPARTEAPPPAEPPPDANGVSFSGGKGTSCADAVVVHAANESTGVPAEYQWLDRHYPGYTRKMQALIQCGSRPADQLSITTADGKDIDVFFDIGEYFGKF